MPRYVALLRAINVGGHTVKMERLRELFAEAGVENVETFIASGNVIFESDSRDGAALEREIEKHLEEALGYEVGTFIRTLDEIAAVANYDPFPKAAPVEKGHTLSVIFLRSAPGKETGKKLDELRSELHDFNIRGRELYWLSREGVGRTPVGPKLGKAIEVPGTSRNVTTIRKLAAKYPPE
jgi:uncharacterized protein (DUF1697 family)